MGAELAEAASPGCQAFGERRDLEEREPGPSTGSKASPCAASEASACTARERASRRASVSSRPAMTSRSVLMF